MLLEAGMVRLPNPSIAIVAIAIAIAIRVRHKFRVHAGASYVDWLSTATCNILHAVESSSPAKSLPRGGMILK